MNAVDKDGDGEGMAIVLATDFFTYANHLVKIRTWYFKRILFINSIMLNQMVFFKVSNQTYLNDLYFFRIEPK